MVKSRKMGVKLMGGKAKVRGIDGSRLGSRGSGTVVEVSNVAAAERVVFIFMWLACKIPTPTFSG